jgi:alkylation response protein AidB-like acyl-CoA dehydrogenase
MTGDACRRYRLDGTKHFATGARVADRIIGFVTDPGSGERLLVEIDPGRSEVEFLDDWDVIGERLSASNGLIITDYTLSADEIIGSLGRDDAPRDPHRTLGILSFQLVFVHLLLGTAEGALLAAGNTRGRRPGPGSTRASMPRPRTRTSSPPTGI